MTPKTDLECLNQQIATLYVCDQNERLRFIREPGYDESELDPAPRFFMGRTQTANTWRFRHDLQADIQALNDLCYSELTLDSYSQTTPTIAFAIRKLLNQNSPISQEERGPAYWIPEATLMPSQAVLITDLNAHLLEAHFPWKITSQAGYKFAPLIASVANGNAVSICYCARLTDFAAEAGVETTESFRGQGYASDAVALWASVMRSLGRLPLYSTSWENLASQGVARKLGMLLYAENWWID